MFPAASAPGLERMFRLLTKTAPGHAHAAWRPPDISPRGAPRRNVIERAATAPAVQAQDARRLAAAGKAAGLTDQAAFLENQGLIALRAALDLQVIHVA